MLPNRERGGDKRAVDMRKVVNGVMHEPFIPN
jgi:hypothetical protein